MTTLMDLTERSDPYTNLGSFKFLPLYERLKERDCEICVSYTQYLVRMNVGMGCETTRIVCKDCLNYLLSLEGKMSHVTAVWEIIEMEPEPTFEQTYKWGDCELIQV